MSKTPFYRVAIASSGRDISNLIASFTFEDCTEEDDLLKISMKNKDISIIDDPDFVEGTVLNFQWGYLGGRSSKPRQAKITDIDCNYGSTIDITISASDLGRELKMTESNKIWKNKNASQIVAEIAKKYNMSFQITGQGPKIYKDLPQGNRTDFEFLHYLCSIEAGNKIFYVKDNIIFFVNIDLDKDPIKAYTYNEGNGSVIRFKPKIKKDKKNAAAGETSINDIDPKTKGNINAKSTDTQKKTGKYVYNANSDQLSRRDTEGLNTSTGKSLGVSVQDSEDARNTAEKAKQSAELDGITADLETEGDVDLRADEIITMAGVAKKHQGNWYTSKITHTIDSGGYKCRSELKKNGTSKPVSQGISESTNVNNKRSYTYNENSNLVNIKTKTPD